MFLKGYPLEAKTASSLKLVCLSAKHKILTTKFENYINTHAHTNNQYHETLVAVDGHN